MAKFILGFVAGVLITVIVLSFSRQGSESNQTMAPALPTAVQERAQSAPETESVADEANEIETTSVVATDDPAAVDLASPTITSVDPVVSGQASSAAIPVQTSGSSAQPSDYPPEIADMLENRNNRELHERYQADPREDSWATYMEGQLQAYFAQKPEVAQFNFSYIGCRSTMCEVHAVGYGVDALTQWNIATADFVTQTWHDFNQMSMDRHNPQPDILGIVMILTRQQSQPSP